MSVFKRKNSETYEYDFQLKGRRFCGNTKEKNKRSAEIAEKSLKEAALAQILEEAAFSSPDMTFEIAASRYWIEVGQHHKRAEGTIWSLAWLVKHLGKSIRLSDVDDNQIALLVARRRKERDPKYKNKKTAPFISNRTVNTTITKVLRKIITRAKSVWKAKTADIVWNNHLLPEPRERVREASSIEENDIMHFLKRGYDDAIEFAFLNGVRRMEILSLCWSSVDFFGKRFTVLGKGDKLRTIPMTDRTYEILWNQRGNHNEKVFTYEAARTSKAAKTIRGERYPLTDAGLKTAMRRACEKAGVVDFHFHDTRHTTATRVLRNSNLRVVQILLGHDRVTTTEKYAHAHESDVLEGLNAASPERSPVRKNSKGYK